MRSGCLGALKPDRFGLSCKANKCSDARTGDLSVLTAHEASSCFSLGDAGSTRAGWMPPQVNYRRYWVQSYGIHPMLCKVLFVHLKHVPFSTALLASEMTIFTHYNANISIRFKLTPSKLRNKRFWLKEFFQAQLLAYSIKMVESDRYKTYAYASTCTFTPFGQDVIAVWG